jgi:hypothetical protein
MMTDSIVVKRLVRSLRYKLTYIKVFESFLKPAPPPAMVKLLNSLMGAQQAAALSLSSYLQGLDVETQDLPLCQDLMDHAAQRFGVRARLHFIYYGLDRAASWYKTQLVDRQMTADPELRNLLLDLGEREAASLWYTEAVMVLLRIGLNSEAKDRRRPSQVEPGSADGWRPRLMGTERRPDWSGQKSANRSRRS